jgi:histidyl-tRNA synthetase
MAQKPSIPKGTRDFSPEVMVKRNYIFDTIKAVYQRYGFLPIETPAMETLETLMGKYGEEGDKLIFKILPRGEKLINLVKAVNKLREPRQYGDIYKEEIPIDKLNPPILDHLAKGISEEALRYDLTVPFARYVVMHQNEITFPFKRYQIQPVWRADRPQKGRYREFYQCDADVIGSDSLLNEVELTQIIDDVFTALQLPVVVKINNRKILSGIAEVIGESERIVDITVAIDKLDKIGVDGVNQEMQDRGVSDEAISRLQPLIRLQGDTVQKLAVLIEMLASSDIGKKGIAEIEYVFNTVLSLGLKSAKLEFDVTLARGLNYYTGAIFEVKVDNERCASQFTSSILGGGRYDDLTGIFGLPDVSGVGISFGADRIYDVLEELNLYPQSVAASTKVLFVNFGIEEEKYCLKLLQTVRSAGISAELYPGQAKMKKQMGYADAKKIPYVVLVGTEEMSSGKLTLKNMQSGEQEKVTVEELVGRLK